MARQLGARFGLPVFHLDQAWWRPGWIEAPPQAFRAEVERIAALPEWVIDGNFTVTIAPRFSAVAVGRARRQKDDQGVRADSP